VTIGDSEAQRERVRPRYGILKFREKELGLATEFRTQRERIRTRYEILKLREKELGLATEF
jgi:hypothetical protein